MYIAGQETVHKGFYPSLRLSYDSAPISQDNGVPVDTQTCSFIHKGLPNILGYQLA